MKHIDDLRLSIGPSAGPKVDHLSEGIETAARAVRKLIDHTPTSIHTGYSLTEIAMSLPPATSLVEFYFSRGSVFAFCISNRECEVVPVARVDDVIRLHRLVRFQLRGRPRLGADTDAHRSLMQHLEGLHVLLWGSVAPLVTSRNIVVVPHGFLHQLPFHALFDGETFLIDRHAITYSPSAGVFCATRTRSDKGCASGNLVVGASDSDIPQVSSEVRAVAEMLPHTKVFLDDEATKARLLDELPRANVIHIAGHGYFSPTEPSDSAVAFGREPLTVKELQELNLRAELVVLSGCETGRSATKGSDEILGVTQALLRAGARSALVSLWKVDDESTACFMRQFYSELHHLSDRAEALRRAQIVHRTMFRHPFFWAPFVLVGDPMPSSTRTTPPRD
jgi:hypothetical protein